ncbi:MAG: DNA gyrase modulator, partial [Candidatus Cloacimonetes bacterium]|nr:DNA gyrase modulator [Candidatus Cloacimonadota bacterium]
MFEEMKKIIGKSKADYADIRYEVKKVSSISFAGKELDYIGSNSTDGFVIRVLKNGGMSSIAFTKEKDAEKALRIAEENAELMAKNTDHKIAFADSPAIKDSFKPKLVEDPRNISIEEKLELVKKYDEQIM